MGEFNAAGTSIGDWSCRKFPFFAFAAVWLATVYVVSREQALEKPLLFGIGILLVGIPICFAGICSGTLRQQRRVSAIFRARGWLYTLWLGRWLRILLWTVWSLGISIFLLLQLYVYDPVRWAILVLIIPLFSIIFDFINRRLSIAGMHQDMAVTQALALSRWLSTAVIVLLYVVAVGWLGDPPRHETVQIAIDAMDVEFNDWNGNALVGEALHWLAHFRGIEAFVLGEFHAMNLEPVVWLLALMVLGIGNFALVYNACLAISCFRIPQAAFMQAGLFPRTATGAFAAAAIATFLPIFVFLPLLAQLEPWAAEMRAQRVTLVEAVDAIRAEFINEDSNCVLERQVNNTATGCLYKEGTAEKIRTAHNSAILPVGAAAGELRREISEAFARLENEAVEEYLDWYYSLAGEYGRLGAILSGGLTGLEERMAEQSNEVFGQERWFREVNEALNRLSEVDAQARREFERAQRNILETNRLEPGQTEAEIEVVLAVSLDDIVRPSIVEDFVSSTHRFGASGVGGSVAGVGVAMVVANKVTAKMVGKSLFKVAAKVPLKGLASKAGAGALAGGVVGSTVPILGTTVGAIAGVFVAIGGGVAIDATLLELEEVLSRKDFKREFIAAIQEARREFENEYLGDSVP